MKYVFWWRNGSQLVLVVKEISNIYIPEIPLKISPKTILNFLGFAEQCFCRPGQPKVDVMKWKSDQNI